MHFSGGQNNLLKIILLESRGTFSFFVLQMQLSSVALVFSLLCFMVPSCFIPVERIPNLGLMDWQTTQRLRTLPISQEKCSLDNIFFFKNAHLKWLKTVKEKEPDFVTSGVKKSKWKFNNAVWFLNIADAESYFLNLFLMYKYRSQFGLWAPKHQERIICTAVYLCPNSEEETGLVQWCLNSSWCSLWRCL